MPITSEQLTFTINVDSSGAVTGFKTAGDGAKKYTEDTEKAEKQTGSITGAFGRFGASAVVLNQSVELVSKAFNALVGPISSVVQSWAGAEFELNQMANAMALQGTYSKEALAAMDAWSGQMQKTTTVAGGVAMTLGAVAKATGLTDVQVRKLVETSTDLAAATGTGVNEAFNQLLGQFAGIRGRVAKFVPELENLTEAELRAGAGIDVVARKFDGFAKGEANTLLGIQKRLSNAWDDVKDKMGKLVVDFVSFPGASDAMFKALLTLGAAVDRLAIPMLAVRDALIQWATAFENTITAMGGFDAVITPLIAKVEIFAATIALMFAPQIVAGLATLTTALWGFIAPLIVAAAKFTLMAAGIAIVAASVDILLRNLNRLGELGETIAGAFTTLVERLKRGFMGVGLAILSGIEMVLEALPDTLRNKLGLGDDVMDGIRNKMLSLADAMDETNKQIEVYDETLKDVSKNVDFGFAGEVWEKGSKFIKQFNKELETTKGLTQEINDTGPTNRPQGGATVAYAGKAVFEPGMIEEMGKSFGAVFGAETAGAATTAANAINSAVGPALGAASSMASIPTAIMAAFDMVLSVFQKVIDFIPGILNKLAGLINSIADLPLQIMEAAENFLNSFRNLVANLIPNIMKNIASSLENSVSFLEDIPDLFLGMIDSFVDILIDDIIARLPDLIGRFVTAMITFFPKMWGALLKLIIVGIPQIIKALWQAMRQLPTILYRALEEAWLMVRDLIVSIFKGGMDMSSIGDGVSKAFQDAADAVTGVSEQLFSVMDIQADARAAKMAQDIAKAIESATNRAVTLLSWLWDRLKAAWQWVYDTILKPVWDALTAIWMMIKTNILDPFVNALSAAWRWVLDNILTPLGTFVSNAWATVLAAFQTLGTTVSNAWAGVLGLFTNMKATVTSAWSSITSIFSLDSFKSLGSQIWSGLKAGLDTMPAFFTNMFNQIQPGNLFEKIFKMDYKGKGTVEKALNIDIPFANFASGGVVPGNPVVSGDSALNDRIVALLSPGEIVIPRSMANNPILQAVLERLSSGNTLSLFGGAVGAVSGAISSGGSAVAGAVSDPVGTATGIVNKGKEELTKLASALSPEAMWALAKEKAYEVIFNAFAANRFAFGGLAGGTDTLPAMLTPGEFVVNRGAVNSLGTGALNSINRGQMPSTNMSVELNIKIDAKNDNLDESFVRRKLAPTIFDELRRASLDGRFMMSAKGVRA